MKKPIFVFNFKAQFADAVERGIKRQTVRATRKDGRVPKAGDHVHLYTGLRNSTARLLGKGTVLECVPVTMNLQAGERLIALNGYPLTPAGTEAFARLDGFPNAGEMFDWFASQHGLAFSGFCCAWSFP